MGITTLIPMHQCQHRVTLWTLYQHRLSINSSVNVNIGGSERGSERSQQELSLPMEEDWRG